MDRDAGDAERQPAPRRRAPPSQIIEAPTSSPTPDRAQLRRRDDDVEPHDVAGLEQHGAAAAAPPHDLDARRRGMPRRRRLLGPLRRPEHERRPLDVEAPTPSRAPDRRRSAELPGVERHVAGPMPRPLDGVTRDTGGQEAMARYGFHASGTRATLTTTHAVDRGARHGRARRMPASSGVRSRLARLHGRQAAATFSHDVLAAARPRQHVVDRVGGAAAVLAAVVVAGEHGPPRQRGAPVERHLDHVAQPDHERARQDERRRAQLGAVVLDDVGLVGEHQARGPAAPARR